MSNFTRIVYEKVNSAIKDYSMLDCTKKVIVGFSGGADSVCLLYILHKLSSELGFEIEAVHINHGIRGAEAKRDESFSSDFCFKHGIPITIKAVDCINESKLTKESLEECGRRLRYSAFYELCDEFSKIATAHNANDNAETLIFNLARGSSIKGACGIPPTRDSIIRPLIYCTREEIEGFCKENSLVFITDSTNLQDDYTRNRIRHKVISELVDINSSAIENISNFCNNAKDVFDFLSCEAENAIENACVGDSMYDINKLKLLHKAVLSEFIVRSYNKFSHNTLDKGKVKNISSLINDTGRLQLFGDEFVEVVKGRLRFYHNKKNDSVYEIPVSIGESYGIGEFIISVSEFTGNSKLINKKVLDNLIDYDKINGNLFLRTRRKGDKFSLYKRNVSKSLKNLFNELSIPIEQRDKIPVLCDDDGIVWIYSVGACNRCHITESSSNIIYLRGENNG